MAIASEIATTPPDGRSRAKHAYVTLREEIISAEIAPGTLLREDELMQRLGVGRTPVREAIQQLEHDGFVMVIPRRGTLVSEINITSLTGIYEVRVHLEAWEARLAAERVTDGERVEATKLLAEFDALDPNVSAETLLALDRRIHRFVYACGKNTHLAETLDHYHNLSLRILHVAMKRYPSLTPTLDHVVHDQRLLLNAVIRGDGPAAEQAAREHVLTFERAIREVI